jgi:hypothetical protein
VSVLPAEGVTTNGGTGSSSKEVLTPDHRRPIIGELRRLTLEALLNELHPARLERE